MIHPRSIVLLCCAAVACGSSVRHDGHRSPPAAVPGAGAAAGDGAQAGVGAATTQAGGTDAGSNAASGGTDAGMGGAAENPELGAVVLDGTPLYTRVPRLTASQWQHAVTDILRFAEPANLARGFIRPPSGTSDFENNEKLLLVDSTNFLDFEAGA